MAILSVEKKEEEEEKKTRSGNWDEEGISSWHDTGIDLRQTNKMSGESLEVLTRVNDNNGLRFAGSNGPILRPRLREAHSFAPFLKEQLQP